MKYPVVATRGIITFPKHKNLIEIGRPVSINAVNLATVQYESKLVLVSQRSSLEDEVKSIKDIYPIGTLVSVTVTKNYDNGAKQIEVTGLERFKINSISIKKNQLIEAEGSTLESKSSNSLKEQALIRQISTQIDSALGKLVNIPREVMKELASGISATDLTDIVGQYMPLSLEKKYELLSQSNINKRLEFVSLVLNEEQQINEIERDLDRNVRSTLDSQQKEYLLRERLKAIKEELGEISSKDSDIDEIREKLQDSKYPQYVVDKINEELKKYEAMPPISAEANVSKTYIDWLVKLPWNTVTKDSTDIEAAKQILNKHHYGLKKVKERIIEHLAVKANTKSDTAPILTLVGPPGVGKTSLAKSIAEALGRHFVKISLGGVRDEAEIRGHRRTYVGSMPGKIINGINKSKVSNPIILLDEIDKMASDFKGDPTSAMLEVLDLEQNKNFQDHYLEIEYDLSKVMFVATANYYENIPAPLLDRVEIINLSSYTEGEKMEIAKRHLIPKVIRENGLTKSQFKLTDKMIKYLIKHFTLEAGVRGLKRILDKLARKVVLRKLEGKIKGSFPLTEKNILTLLGKQIFIEEKKESKKIVGTVTGLAYTEYGGSTLPVEVTTFKGKGGGLKITGQLKDVMKESASIALAYVRAHADEFKINFDFENTKIHIHVPEGAVPKDGPSAGVTFTSALISALSNKSVSPLVAMTGEITLRGKVLAIGGLKEKSLAAVRRGVKTIYIPESNTKDIDDIPKEARDKLKIIPVSTYSQIYSSLF